LAAQETQQDLHWRDSLEEAREEARRDGKLVLIYLWHHNCGGSRTMGTDTYPDGTVRSYVEEHFIPIRFNVLERPETEDRFNSGWTPTVIVEDAEGREHRRSQGYLDPRRFVGELALSRLKDAIDRRDFGSAFERSGNALKQTEDDPARRSEALYWSAVAAYRVSGDRNDLIEGWNGLLEMFPRSEWAERAGYIRKR
jgi:thioredoxin-related protein